MQLDTLNNSKYKDLIEKAREAKSYAYSPYSGFNVGAALLTNDGIIYTGCNIENIAYGPTNCAERTAIFKAVSEGKKNFKAIAITGNFDDESLEKIDLFTPPCGVCRQVMAEFCHEDEFYIVLANDEDQVKIYRLKELLPESFNPYSE